MLVSAIRAVRRSNLPLPETNWFRELYAAYRVDGRSRSAASGRGRTTAKRGVGLSVGFRPSFRFPLWVLMNKLIVVTREQLYEQVWTIPTQTLAKQYGISDVGLSKICRRLNVPKPGLGYWAKVDAGQTPPRTPLPGRALEHSYEIRPRPPELVETEEQCLAREACEQLRQNF